jgi:hypothetical protein
MEVAFRLTALSDHDPPRRLLWQPSTITSFSAWRRVGLAAPSASAQESYQDVVHEHARQGWQLVPIFAAGTAVYGHAAFYELIFERPLAQHTPLGLESEAAMARCKQDRKLPDTHAGTFFRRADGRLVCDLHLPYHGARTISPSLANGPRETATARRSRCCASSQLELVGET